MTSRKSELLATLEIYLNNTEEIVEEEVKDLKDVASKRALSKEHYSETLRLQIICCNKDNATFDGAVTVAMFVHQS